MATVAMLSIPQAAEMLGVSVNTVRSWIYRRQKLTIVKCGKAIRIPESSVREFIEKNTIPPARERR